jgi:hypothetical protein
MFLTLATSPPSTGPTSSQLTYLQRDIPVSHSVKQASGKDKTMSDTYGPTLPLPLMRYDLASLSWRTCEATSLWDLEMSFPTFPEWGMTRNGELFERPTPGLHMRGLAYSSLPTPTNADDANYLLPTPVADHSRGLAQPGTDFASLPNVAIVVAAMLPTPTVMDMGSNYTPEEWEAWKLKQKEAHSNGNGHGASLTQEVLSIGENTAQPSTAGRYSLDDQHQPPLFPATTANHD